MVLERAFSGFTALPAPIVTPSPARPWREVLEYGNGPATEEEINRNYRILARTAHPDRGGSNAAMSELNTARDQALKECSHEIP